MVRKKKIKESGESFHEEGNETDRSRSPLKTGRSSSRSSSSSSEASVACQRSEDDAMKRLKEENLKIKAESDFLRQQVSALTAIIQGLREDIAEMRKEMRGSPKETMLAQPHQLIDEPMDATPGCLKRGAEHLEEPEERTAKKSEVSPINKNSPPIESPKLKPTKTVETPVPTTDKAPKIPPIVLRQKDKWSEVSKRLSERRIQYTKAKLTADGIQVTPASVDSFRATTKLLTEAKYEFHPYSLPEEKVLRAVIRDLPEGISNEEIKDDLIEKGFSVQSVQRMTSRKTKKAMPLVLVKLPQGQESILDVNRCCALVVKTERQREAQQITQCHRCQRFGHAQSKCTAQAKCVKCGQAHSTQECKKAKDSPAKCANCQGAHPASYRGCPSCPKQPARRPPAPTTSQARSPAPQNRHKSQQTHPRSFADATKTGKKTNPPVLAPSNNEDHTSASLTATLAQMQQMCAAMSAFFAKLPSTMTG